MDIEDIYWRDHPEHPSSDWIYEVNNGDTRLGYWEWVGKKFEENAEKLYEELPKEIKEIRCEKHTDVD